MNGGTENDGRRLPVGSGWKAQGEVPGVSVPRVPPSNNRYPIPFIVPPNQRLKPHWTPPSPAVSENARRYDALFTTGEDARLQITFVARRINAPFWLPGGAVRYVPRYFCERIDPGASGRAGRIGPLIPGGQTRNANHWVKSVYNRIPRVVSQASVKPSLSSPFTPLPSPLHPPSSTSRSGFLLVELLVATLLMVIIFGGWLNICNFQAIRKESLRRLAVEKGAGYLDFMAGSGTNKVNFYSVVFDGKLYSAKPNTPPGAGTIHPMFSQSEPIGYVLEVKKNYQPGLWSSGCWGVIQLYDKHGVTPAEAGRPFSTMSIFMQ